VKNACGTPCMYNPLLDLRKPELRVLDIGNSYTGDATHYIKEIMAGCGVTPPDRWSMPEDMALVCAIRSGGSWKNWFDILHDADTNGYDIYKSFGGLSVSIKGSDNGSSGTYKAGDGSGFRHLLENNTFDLILIHPVSQAAPYSELWENESNNGYLSKLIRLLRIYQPQATIGSYLVHSYSESNTSNTEGSSLARWQKIADGVKRLRENYGIDFVIPYGTAIQNLRTSSLNNAPYDLTEDGLHSASGISDYTAACCYYQALIAPRYGRSVLGCTARIDQGTLNAENESRNIAAEYRGSAKAVTDATARVCQMAAFLACQNWYKVQNPEDFLTSEYMDVQATPLRSTVNTEIRPIDKATINSIINK
ncbi:MAG: DUF4886 domain-containing protein, partial [Muribaculaceae bacterium]|nr:DUF4886 domain-containing protein [Muribaculaceae bacterium]